MLDVLTNIWKIVCAKRGGHRATTGPPASLGHRGLFERLFEGGPGEGYARFARFRLALARPVPSPLARGELRAEGF